MIRNILFDLDGTLTDPGPGIKNSIRYALKKEQLPPLPEETLNAFIGPPLIDSFMKYCGASAEEARHLTDVYREYFREKGLYENTVYPGIPEVLQKLKERGFRLYLATSKPEPFAKIILEHFGLAGLFTFIGGATMEETRTKKDEVIQYVLEENRLIKEECLMVGDRSYDIDGAHQCGLCAIGVLYGYGTIQELKDAEAWAQNPEELLDI